MSAGEKLMTAMMDEKALLDLLAQRMIGALRDPDMDGLSDEDRAFNEGVAAARKFVEAARDDKFCPHCGYPQHRDSEGFEGVSLRRFAAMHGPKGMRMLR